MSDYVKTAPVQLNSHVYKRYCSNPYTEYTVENIYNTSAVWEKQENSLFFLKNLYIMKKVHSFIYIVYYSRRKDENTK